MPELVVAAQSGNGVLAILLNESSRLRADFEEDLSTYSGTILNVRSEIVAQVAEIGALIAEKQPSIVRLVAEFDAQGTLVDPTGGKAHVRELISVAEESGVTLFIIASGAYHGFTAHLRAPRATNVLAIVERNPHFAAFLRGLLNNLSEDPNFALAFVKLAPQHASAQRGRPLPGAIAACPAKPKFLVVWSEAQP